MTTQVIISAALIATVVSEVRPWWMALWFDFLLWLETTKAKILAKPLGMCSKCMAGQIGLWASVYYCGIDPFTNVTDACGAILLASFITKAYQWTQ